MTTALQAIALIAVAAGGFAVVATKNPLAQVFVVGVQGLLFVVFFLAFGAPDVALSQIVVAGVAVPVMVLLALAKIRTVDRAAARDDAEEQ